MKKLNLAGISVATIALSAAPAFSAPLQNWQFDPATNQLELIVPAGVRPQYFLLAQPARIVVNLPGTQIGGVVPEASYNGSIRQIRVSQFQPQLARIVLELAPNVTLNPQQAQLQQVKESNPGFDRWILRPAFVAGTSAKTQAVFSQLRPAQTNPVAQTSSQDGLPPAPPATDSSIGGSAAPTISAPQLPTSAPLSPLPSGNPNSSLLFPDAAPLPTQSNPPTTGRSLALPEVNPSLAIPDSFPAINAPASAPTVSVPPLRRSPSPEVQPAAIQSVESQAEPIQAPTPARTRAALPSRVIEFGQPLPADR